MTQSESNTKYLRSAFAVYLAITTIPLLAGAMRHSAGPALVAGHMALLAAALWLAFRPTPRWTEWLPMIAIPFLYAELPALMPAFGGALHDPTVQGWEASLFGVSPAQTLAGHFPSPILSETLHAGYLSYYPLIYVPPLIAWYRRRTVAFEQAVSAVIVTFLVCCVVFVVWPVAGPRFLWASPPGIPSGPVRSLVLALLEAGSSRGAAFPSSHVAVAVAQTWVALRYQRAVGIACAVCTILLATGAVYGGFHYGVDVLAGAVVGAVVGALLKTTRR